MQIRTSIWALVSVFLHAFLAYLLFFNDNLIGNITNSNSTPFLKGKIVPNAQTQEIEIIEKQAFWDFKKHRRSKTKKYAKECKSKRYYGGIGINTEFNTIFNTGAYRITKVFDGYPASEAGLQVNDIIQAIDSPDIIGEPGTYVLVKIIRNGQIFILNIKRAKICYEI